MYEIDFTYAAPDGQQLFIRVWQPDTEASAVVLLVHGLGEHSGRYQHVARAFCAQSIAMVSFDLRGHGNTPGQRGHIPSLEVVMSDIDLLVAEAQRRFPGKPVFLYGHSLGGLLVLNFVLRRKPQLVGVITSAPGLRSPLLDQRLKVLLSKALGAFLPTISLPTGLDVALLSHDPEVVRTYQSDPLVHDQATLGTAKALIRSIEYVDRHAAEFLLPLLVIHGSADQLVYVSGSQALVQRIPSSTLKLWDGLYHETHNEIGAETVLSFTLDWVKAQNK